MSATASAAASHLHLHLQLHLHLCLCLCLILGLCLCLSLCTCLRLLTFIIICYTLWVQIQWLENCCYTSRFSVIFQNSQNCKQITATPRRSIFHAAKSVQMPYKATNQKITCFHNKIKNPLELRLVLQTMKPVRSMKPMQPMQQTLWTASWCTPVVHPQVQWGL
jgi:hypothetical protein